VIIGRLEKGFLSLNDYGPGYRVYFAQIEMLVLLLLGGGDKSTQDRDIQKAKQFWSNFNQRDNANE
jgi:putative addiction module killer protein